MTAVRLSAVIMVNRNDKTNEEIINYIKKCVIY